MIHIYTFLFSLFPFQRKVYKLNSEEFHMGELNEKREGNIVPRIDFT